MKLADLRRKAVSGIKRPKHKVKKEVTKEARLFSIADPPHDDDKRRRVIKCKCGKLISIEPGFTICPKCGFDNKAGFYRIESQLEGYNEIVSRLFRLNSIKSKKKKK